MTSSGGVTSPTGEGRPRGWEILALGAVLLLHAVTLFSYFVPTVGMTDDNSYHLCAREFEKNNRLYQLAEDDYDFVGVMWVVNDRGEYYPKYPPFYPLVAGVVMKAFGDPAGLMVNPICLLLSVLGTWVLCRALLPGWAAILAAWLMSTIPLLDTQCLQQGAHASSIAFATWAFALFFVATRASWRQGDQTVCRPSAGLLFGSGLLLGYSVGIRNPNILLGVAPALWLWWQRARLGNRGLIAWLVGAALPVAGLAAYHWAAFGHPLHTGYAYVDEQTAFSLDAFVKHARYYVPAMIKDAFGAPLLAMALGGIVLSLRRGWRETVFWSLWIGPFTALYMSYYWAPEGHTLSFLRFLCPMTLPFVVLAVVFVRDLVALLPRVQLLLLVALAVVPQGVWAVPKLLEYLEVRYAFNDLQHRKVEFIRDNVPKRSTVFAELWICDALEYHQEYLLRTDDLLDREKKLRQTMGFYLSGKDGRQKKRVDVWQAELLDVDFERYQARIRALIDASLAGEQGVYVVGTELTLAPFRANFGGAYALEVVALQGDDAYLKPRQRLFDPRRGGSVEGMPQWARLTIIQVRPK